MQINTIQQFQTGRLNITLTGKLPVAPYPLNAFPSIVKNAAEEVIRHVKAPDALIGMSFLTALSVSCQGLIDVRLPTGQVCPVSLNIKVIAESGERKSAVDTLVSAPIYSHDELRTKKYDADIVEYHIALRFWKAVDAGIRRKISTTIQKNLEVDHLFDELKSHEKNKPLAPRSRRVMRHNASERAIMDALAGDGEMLAFMSDEGEIILKGGAMDQSGFRNKGWDGARILTLDRADLKSVIARNPRVTIAFMVQHKVLQNFLKRRGEVMRGSGSWARYLMGWPDSTQGYRFMSYDDPVWAHLPVFHARVAELLDEYGSRIEVGTVQRTVIEFSGDAKVRWIDLLNRTESMIQPWGYLDDIKDFASKAMEITGRVAALLHWFSNEEGAISVNTLNCAIDIVGWHLEEFKRIFSPQNDAPQVQVDVQVLENYLYSHYWCRNFSIAPKNDVLRNGPVRPRLSLDAALDYLCELGRIRITIDSKRKRYINLNHQYFASMHQGLYS